MVKEKIQAEIQKCWDEELKVIKKVFLLGQKEHLFTIAEMRNWYDLDLRFNRKNLNKALGIFEAVKVEQTDRKKLDQYISDTLFTCSEKAGLSFQNFKVCRGFNHLLVKATPKSVIYNIKIFYPNCESDFQALEKFWEEKVT